MECFLIVFFSLDKEIRVNEGYKNCWYYNNNNNNNNNNKTSLPARNRAVPAELPPSFGDDSASFLG
uniref:Uncharacterized protein n=1 Tax=Timema bartmani TaxID=61472 RepID=A0A7R9ERB8_9NEOP|nr:unnamed protein product [Timema bartmani]